MAVGSNDEGQCNVSDWRDIIAVAAGGRHTLGLKADGTVVAAGITDGREVDFDAATSSNDYGQCNVSDWRDIVAISAGYIHSVGLKRDGTVVAVGSNYCIHNVFYQCEVSEWRDIVAISAGGYITVGLKKDGTVIVTAGHEYGSYPPDNSQRKLLDWTNIVAVSGGGGDFIGLKSDGTVVAVGDEFYGQNNVSGWRDVVALSSSRLNAYGLKSDNTVIATGDARYGQFNVLGWRDIIAISCKNHYVAGLKRDGTVVAVGWNAYTQCDVSDWNLGTYTNDEISVTLNGKRINFPDQPPIIKNDRTLVPLRAIFEAMGATIDLNGATQTVTAQRGGRIIQLTIGSTKAMIGDKEYFLDVAPIIHNERTLVPVRFVAESFDAHVWWDASTRTVEITDTFK